MSPTIDYRRKWLVMAAVAMSTFLSTIDGSIVNVALPTLVRELDTEFATVEWVILAYLLTQTTLLLSVGRLGDMIGKKPIYTAGIIVFTTGSILCGLAPGIYWLIGFRVLQAVGAAMTLGLSMAIVTEAFPATERGKALGINGTVVSIGIVLGPTVGGLILDALTWRWIFFVNLPIGIIGTVLALRFVPDVRPSGGQRFDLAGAVTLLVSLLSVLLALTFGQHWGFDDPRALSLFLSFALFLAIFVIVELRVPQPMLDLRLFRNKLFSASLLMGMLAFIAIAGTTLLLPFYLDGMRGFPPRQVGLMMAFIPAFLGIVAPLAGSLSDRVGTRPIALVGLVIALGGYLLMSTLDLETGLLAYALAVTPLGLGMGFFQSPNNSAIMGAAPPERLGVASGLLAISRTLGQITGIATLGALWAGRVATYAGAMPEGGATAAALPAQVAALNDTFLAMAVLLAMAVIISIWTIFATRRQRATAIVEEGIRS